MGRPRHSPLRGELSDEALQAQTNARLRQILIKNGDVDHGGSSPGSHTPPAPPGRAKAVPDSGRKIQAGSTGADTDPDDADEEISVAGRTSMPKAGSKAPMIIFSKSYCPYSRRAKEVLLHEYDIVPKPYVIQDLLKTLTGRATVPNIMIASQSLGGSDEIVDLHNQGLLAERIRKMAGQRIVSVELVSDQDRGDN
ncbi:hypothetical protein DV738_g2814, partial [Chaetothyriales sp. CBS 135597]